MKRLLPTLLAVFLAIPAGHARTLAEAATQQAKRLPVGCIVTGELLDGGKASFAIAGKAPEAKGGPPEKWVFEIGSITKVFTGLLLAQAVVEKKVTLETTVAEVLGKDAQFADPRVAAITLKQLSTHTSGLPRLPSNHAAGVAEDDPYANYDEKLLLAYIQGEKLRGEGPYTCSYSNIGVGLLGYLLGRVYDSTWDKAMLEKVCRPLGLHDTAVTPPDGLVVATPNSGKKEVKPWHLAAVGGAGALRSTAADMLRFGEAILHPEKTPLDEAFAIALQPHAEAPADGGHIGLGIFINKQDGEQTLHHDGGTGGYRSGLQVIPAKGIVRVALINNDELGGSEVIAATSEAKAAAAKNLKEIALPADQMKNYPGVYELDRDTRFTLVLHKGKLWLRLTGQAFLPMSAMAADRFFNTRVAAEVGFTRDKEQKIQSLTLYQHGRELTAKRKGDAPKVIMHTAEELAPYKGEYALMGMKKLWIEVRASTLFAKLEGQEFMPVFQTAADRFEYDVVEAALVFTRDDNKNLTGLVLQQNGMTVTAPRVKPPPGGVAK